MDNNLTVIYLTLNNLPQSWTDYHMIILRQAIENLPVISISRIPINFGDNYIQEGPYGYVNIYQQILFACEKAKTPFISVAEDDTLYCKDHFTAFRPKLDEVAYNKNRWGLYTWDRRFFSLRNRVTTAAMIAPRELVINALEERFQRLKKINFKDHLFGELGRPSVEGPLGVSPVKVVYFYSDPGIVQLSHPFGIGDKERRKKKKHAPVKAIELWSWGRAEDIIDIFKAGK